jgi:hypothetical protein
MKMKRVVVISDLHSGHKVGLTHPDFDAEPPSREDEYAERGLYEIRRSCWDFYAKTIKELGKIDALIVNGDMIDGPGEKSGGTEQITTDCLHQAEMAAAAINFVGSPLVYGTIGTGYHTGQREDFEKTVAKDCKMRALGSHEWYDINGTIFDCKHHCSSSGMPTGRHNAAAKERLWNLLWAEFGEQPKSDVIIRSHVHYHAYCGQENWLAMTTPALQAKGSKYGKRRCSGTVHFGLVHFDVYGKGDYSWRAHITRIASQNCKAIVVR